MIRKRWTAIANTSKKENSDRRIAKENQPLDFHEDDVRTFHKSCCKAKTKDRAKLFYDTWVFISAFVTYVNSLDGDFLHDDIPAILRNPDVRGDGSAWRVFNHDFWGEPITSNRSHKSYRPLCVLTFRLNHYLFGFDAFSFHFVNVTLHAIASVFVSHVCRQLVFKDDLQLSVSAKKSFFVGMIFSLHPIHTEAVSNVVGRAEILAAIFYLLSLMSYCKSSASSNGTSTAVDKIFFLISLLTAGCAMLFKEIGITVLGILIFIEIFKCFAFFDSHFRLKASQFGCRPMVIALWAFFLLYHRLSVMQWTQPHFAAPDNPASKCPYLFTRLLTYSYIAYINIRILVFPLNLLYDWSYGTIPLITSATDYRNITTFVFAIFSIVFIGKTFRSCWYNRTISPKALGLLLLIFPYIPCSNLFFPVGFVVAERTLYIPSIGFSVLVICLWDQYIYKRLKHSIISYSFIVLLCLLFGTRTYFRNQDWQTKRSLFWSGVQEAPNNAKVRYNWANYLREIEKYDEAVKEYKETLRLYPSYPGALNNLATILEKNESTCRKAEELYVRLIQIEPDRVEAYLNLADLFLRRNKYETAVNVYLKLLQRQNPRVTYALSLAELLLRNNQTVNAEKLYIRILYQFCSIQNESSITNVLKRRMLEISGLKDVFLPRNCLKTNSELSRALLSFSSILTSLGRIQDSQEVLKVALHLNNSHADTRVAYSELMLKLNYLDEADLYMIEAVELDRLFLSRAWRLAENHYNEKRTQRAKNMIQTLLNMFPDDMNLASQMALIFYETGEKQRASSILANIVERDIECKIPGAWLLRAEILAQNHETARAHELLKFCVGKLGRIDPKASEFFKNKMKSIDSSDK